MARRRETEDEAYERWRDDHPEEHEEMLIRLGITRFEQEIDAVSKFNPLDVLRRC